MGFIKSETFFFIGSTWDLSSNKRFISPLIGPPFALEVTLTSVVACACWPSVTFFFIFNSFGLSRGLKKQHLKMDERTQTKERTQKWLHISRHYKIFIFSFTSKWICSNHQLAFFFSNEDNIIKRRGGWIIFSFAVLVGMDMINDSCSYMYYSAVYCHL